MLGKVYIRFLELQGNCFTGIVYGYRKMLETTAAKAYAVNRYFSSSMGRFTSPDPFGGSGKPSNPGSWNRYVYTNNDPVNGIDPLGLFMYPPDVGDDDDDPGNQRMQLQP